MALPPGTTDEAFLREVDEEFRRDQMLGFWKRWGRWILGAIVAGLLIFAGVLYFQHYSDRSAGKRGEEFASALRALEEGQAAKADPALAKLASGGDAGYGTLARFTQAAQLLAKEDMKGAAAKLGEIAGDEKVAKPFRDEALVRQTAIEFDQLKPDVVIGRLQPLAVPESDWFGSAGEMVAAAYLKQGKRDQAGKLLGKIAQTSTVPESIRQRTVQLASMFGVDAVPQTQEKKTQ